MENEELKNTTQNEETEQEKAKKIFIARLSAFIGAGFVAPISYLIARYNLFKPTNELQIGLWGCIVFFILISLVGTMVWYYFESMKHKYSIWKQIISGALKIVLPLCASALLLQVLKDNIDLTIETLWVFAGCEAVAIPLNPLPKWAFENDVEGQGEIAKKIYDKIKGNTEDGKQDNK